MLHVAVDVVVETVDLAVVVLVTVNVLEGHSSIIVELTESLVTSKAKKLVVEIGNTGEEVVVVETEKVAGVETEKPAGDEVAADANKENTAEVEEQKESEDTEEMTLDETNKDDKEEKAKKAVNINEFLKPGEGENY
uniref:Hyaluronan/mRNA-binding protein domain-containing protein n=1 Tax=Brassica oleracea TaxID=3712 RepID=A0A3P6F3M3_BRAOL|nr:unnamed protein product [Brassica oleracea]